MNPTKNASTTVAAIESTHSAKVMATAAPTAPTQKVVPKVAANHLVKKSARGAETPIKIAVKAPRDTKLIKFIWATGGCSE